MAKRIYIARIEALPNNARGAAWFNILPAPRPLVWSVVGKSPVEIAIGVLDTDTTQHDALIAETTRIKYVPNQFLDVEYQNLGAGAQAQVQDLETFLGWNLTQLTVKNILLLIVGNVAIDHFTDFTDTV